MATIVIDPFVGPSNPPDWIRAIQPAFDPSRLADLGRLDGVLLTHHHGDHTDPEALGPIGQLTNAFVVGPETCIEIARGAGIPEDRCIILAHDQSRLFDDLTVTAVAMQDPGAPDCNGYVIETDGVTVLQCGDSLYFSGFAELATRWAFDAVCLSVGANPPGRNFYLDEAGAARAARDVGARMLIPQHYDLWEGITLEPRRVATVAGWYCSNARVVPAKLGKRITVSAA